jgi:methylglutaconyl-CoA hydratase
VSDTGANFSSARAEGYITEYLLVGIMKNETEPVTYKIEDTAAWITLNRPEKRNALNDEMISVLRRFISVAQDDPQVRSLVITGAGADFCSGADLASLKKITESSIDDNLDDAQRLASLFSEIRHCRLPVIAMVRGRALAGGCGLASACDMVLAAESSRFGYPEVKLGFVPAMVMAILRRNVSEKIAFELITTGAEISAGEAEKIGLINHVYSDDSLEREVRTIVARFAKASMTAVALSKRLLYNMDGMTFDAALQSGVNVNVIARMTVDFQEGIAGFLKKKD